MVDQKKISELYSLYHRRVRGYILHLVHSPETADDLAQDCFLNMLHYAGRHPLEDNNLKSFLFTTAHNLSLNYIRRPTRIESLPLDFTGCMEPGGNLDSWVTLNEEESNFSSKLQAMDETTRQIFTMKYTKNMTTLQMAGQLGVSERTIRRRLKKLDLYFQSATTG